MDQSVISDHGLIADKCDFMGELQWMS